MSLKDIEGYTAFDLYNSTVEGTKLYVSENEGRTEIFTWGMNRSVLSSSPTHSLTFSHLEMQHSVKATGTTDFTRIL
jgi:hypothetical protein